MSDVGLCQALKKYSCSWENLGKSTLFATDLHWTLLKIMLSCSLSLTCLIFWVSSWKQRAFFLKVWANPVFLMGFRGLPQVPWLLSSALRGLGLEDPHQLVYSLSPSWSRRWKNRQETSSMPRSLIGESENSGIYREISQAEFWEILQKRLL